MSTSDFVEGLHAWSGVSVDAANLPCLHDSEFVKTLVGELNKQRYGLRKVKHTVTNAFLPGATPLMAVNKATGKIDFMVVAAPEVGRSPARMHLHRAFLC